MKQLLSENARLLITIAIFIGGFGLFIAAANNGSSLSTNTSEYKKVNFNSPMTKGSSDALVQLIQYSDFLCPSCTLVSTQVMPAIEKKYIDNGKVAFEFRPMAFVASSEVTSFGSTIAAEGAYCAVDQDKFWQYHDAVYMYTYDKIMGSSVNPQYVATSTSVVTTDTLKTLAKDAGLESGTFDSCLDGRTRQSDVKKSGQAANRNGITSAPTVLLNGVDVSSSATNLSALEALIEAQLK